jgi:2-polyprenyl-6-hydroxyphenyl methylase/3-demethylubiquinone-9 3-methyltransferase
MVMDKMTDTELTDVRSTDTGTTNADPVEINRFNDWADGWWNPEGEMKALHKLNPLRADYIDERVSVSGKTILDVGCGGGLLSEALATKGGKVTGIDLAPASLAVARQHAEASGVEVTYLEIAAEELAREKPGHFDVVTCLEVLEHVPDPAKLVACCAELVRPGGDVIFSTINRNAKSFAMAIVGAEYVLGLVPKGTHEYAKLIRPGELDDWARPSGLRVQDLTGMHYWPLTESFSVGGNVDVNYYAHFRAREAT